MLNKIHYKKQLFILCLFLFYTSFSWGQNVTNGYIDLSKVNWEEAPHIELNGEWDFYWNQWVLPENELDNLNNKEKLTAKLPSSWSKITGKHGTPLPDTGFATYRLRVKVPNEKRVYGLKLYSIFSSYNLYLNGELILESGNIAKSKPEAKPQFKITEVPIPVIKKQQAQDQTLDLVFHASNYHHRRCGIQQPIYFGTMDSVVSQTENKIILGLFMVGIILIIGLNHSLMYFLRRIEISNLIFGVLCLIMILRELTTGERILTHWFPNMNWEWLVRLDNFSGFATIGMFALFFYKIFPKQFPKKIFYFLIASGIAISILVFTSNAYFYGQFRLIFEMYIGLGGLFLTFYVLLGATIKGENDGFLTFIGMLLLYITAVNDVLSSMGVIHTTFLASYGLVAYMVIQSFLLTRKSALALKANQELSSELENEKSLLEHRIQERTKELSTQAFELEKHRKKQEKQHWINESLNIVTEVMKENKESYEQLADQVLSTIVKRTQCYLGAIYFLENIESEDKLKLIAHYGLSNEQMTKLLDPQEGLTGHCFSTKEIRYMNELPEDFFEISSGLGKSKPNALVLIPLIVDDKAIGVLELATFKNFSEECKEFLEKSSSIVASQLNVIKMNSETQFLLNNYRKYEDLLKQTEEDYRKAQLELEELRERLHSN